MYNSKNDTGLKIVGIITLVIVAIFIEPWLSFWIAYFGGWITKITIGGKLVAALNILFHTDYFKVDMLPMMAGALGWIGGFFKSIKTASSKN